ncbi:putative aminoglycoside phosphotransferase (plasmid) [Cupriavidus metallidurans CH34]|uniref:Aminoglycoside phosphotransferase n=1 Tax=Cupriavidus metallidurans (strain ATCC 43123 / DSM 2839 / NBRC 102507 / CH34) TaxID=266264 RepID=Q1LBU0_CUPMC|nr:putative aminoglycoside phosphotransferase [Cupriavidus metallidurans CH34]
MPGEIANLRRLSGGATKQTWAFEWRCGSAVQQLILQLTGATIGAAGRAPKLEAREDASVMKAARAAGAPAPVVRVILEPEDGMGAGYVTEFIEGETLGRRVVLDEALSGARSVLARQCGEVLGKIHQVPTTDLSFLKVLTPEDEFATYRDLLSECNVQHPALSFAIRWIEEHLPEMETAGLVHADFRTGNLIVGEQGLRCVLDWEIARIGDPMQDLGVLCMRSWRFGGRGDVGGFGARDDLYAGYESVTGRVVDKQRVHFWEAFANLKWAIACVRRGSAQAAGGSQASLELSAIGRRMEEPLWDFMNLVKP